MCSWLDFVFRNQVKMQIFYAKTLTHCALCTGFGWHDSILVAVAAVLQVSSRSVGRFENPEGGGANSKIVGLICPPGWIMVN